MQKEFTIQEVQAILADDESRIKVLSVIEKYQQAIDKSSISQERIKRLRREFRALRIYVEQFGKELKILKDISFNFGPWIAGLGLIAGAFSLVGFLAFDLGLPLVAFSGALACILIPIGIKLWVVNNQRAKERDQKIENLLTELEKTNKKFKEYSLKIQRVKIQKEKQREKKDKQRDETIQQLKEQVKLLTQMMQGSTNQKDKC